MRIIAGDLKGRRLEAPDWDGLRPTSDKLRETLFNVLAARVAGARVLDGYAGTGAVGIEALSRGAASVTFVERDPRAVRLIESNLERCGVADRYAIIRAGFADAPARLRGERFDLVFVDPPYGHAVLDEALHAAEAAVEPDGLVIVEHAARDAPADTYGSLTRTRTLKSGDSALSFFSRTSTSTST
jgi:16S rRNA (guanine(966)-N(2))-methyltransferase RsmD